MKNIPNLITCLNVLCGTLAILCCVAIKGDGGGLDGFRWAWIFIGLAAVADFLDGFMARLLHAYSEIGKELDSLCDLVSFGVAPAVVMFFALREGMAPGWLPWTAALIPVACAFRLAKFNVDTRQTTSFLGLPVPANAIFWIGYSALVIQGNQVAATPAAFLPVLLIICWLMISELPLFSLKIKEWKLRSVWRQMLLVIVAVLFVAVFEIPGLEWLIIFYIVLSILTRK